jgi:hypothetical protein
MRAIHFSRRHCPPPSRRQPDDSLVDSNRRLPVMLNLPYSNDLEQINGIFRTGLARFRPRNYGWRRLQQAHVLLHRTHLT